VVVAAGSGPGVVWLVFLFFLLFFLLFFSSFFSSASLERKGQGDEVKGKVRQKGKSLRAGALMRRPAPPILFCSGGKEVGAGARRIRLPVSSLGRTRPRDSGWRVHR
jgi:hypothetical protein